MHSTSGQNLTAGKFILFIYYSTLHDTFPRLPLGLGGAHAANAGKRHSTRNAELATKCGTSPAKALQCDCSHVHKALSMSSHTKTNKSKYTTHSHRNAETLSKAAASLERHGNLVASALLSASHRVTDHIGTGGDVEHI
jgi:hypothetical protein